MCISEWGFVRWGFVRVGFCPGFISSCGHGSVERDCYLCWWGLGGSKYYCSGLLFSFVDSLHVREAEGFLKIKIGYLTGNISYYVPSIAGRWHHHGKLDRFLLEFLYL